MGEDRKGSLRRFKDLWFEDGTVVLQAGRTLFRVYSGILARHSPIFKDLFTLPQPSDAETYEGCPLVQLAGDDPAEVSHFLLVIHDTNYAQLPLDDASAVASVLRLSAKYEVNALRLQVIRTIAPFFPTTLSSYKGLTDKMASDPAFKHPFSSAVDLCHLASAFEVAAPSFLPYTLLMLQRDPTPIFRIVDAVTNGPMGSQRRLLSPKLRRALLQGRSLLTLHARYEVYLALFRPTNCCDAAKISLLNKILGPDGFIDPLHPRTINGFCKQCKKEIQRAIDVGRVKVWRELPENFGLPAWDELKKTTLDQ